MKEETMSERTKDRKDERRIWERRKERRKEKVRMLLWNILVESHITVVRKSWECKKSPPHCRNVADTLWISCENSKGKSELWILEMWWLQIFITFFILFIIRSHKSATKSTNRSWRFGAYLLLGNSHRNIDVTPTKMCDGAVIFMLQWDGEWFEIVT